MTRTRLRKTRVPRRIRVRKNSKTIRNRSRRSRVHALQLFGKGHMDYLLKTEPTVYSFADLQREKTTIWDGVTNPVALKHLRGMTPGERLVIYHTGAEKSAVGTATVV